MGELRKLGEHRCPKASLAPQPSRHSKETAEGGREKRISNGKGEKGKRQR